MAGRMIEWIVRLGFGAALAAVFIAGTAHAAPPTFTPGPCPVDIGALAPRVTCGVFAVDETRGSSNGRRVAMPVVILKAEGPTGQPPLIVLHGGPGGGAVSGLAARAGAVAGRGSGRKNWNGVDQDVIIFDQRGGTDSVPSLDCGKLNLNDAGPDSDGTVGALKACAARHKAAGVDLSRYNAVEVAHDVQNLRRTLGLKQVDLFGVSYGTRIALEVVRTAPEGVRAVILDSLWPPEAKWVDEGPMPVARAVRLIVSLCAADPVCTKDKPDLQIKVDALVARWLTAPQGGADGRRYPVEDFAQYMMDAAYSGADARAMPGVLQKLVTGDFSPIASYDTDRSPYVEGQHLTHLCKEQFPFETREGVVKNAGSDPLAQALVKTMVRYFDACEGFDVGPIDRRQADPIASDLPIFVLNAGIDPGCPPELARSAVKRFSHGQLAIFPYATHGVTRNSPCAASLARAFLRDPSKPLDQACVATEQTGFHFDQKPGG
ncbi:alpha/beta hydrolase [soil metagenome]